MGLGLKKRKQQINNINENPYNAGSGPNHPSRQVDRNTVFILRDITLENIDQLVFKEFDKKFTLAGKGMDMIMLDTEVAAYKQLHPEAFDKVKEYLALPWFISWRGAAKPLFKVNPSKKDVIYSIPTMKPQGLVYEEYVAPAPIYMRFPYTFKFVTAFRENANQIETQMIEYFKNRRNVLILDGERFEIKMVDKDNLGETVVGDREGTGRTLYTMTYQLEVIGYLRDSKLTQKREAINSITVSLTERIEGDEEILISQSVTKLKV